MKASAYLCSGSRDFLNQCTYVTELSHLCRDAPPPILDQAAVRMGLPELGSPTVGSSFKESGLVLASGGLGGMCSPRAEPVAKNANQAWPAPCSHRGKT